jgi:cell division protease FtsH
MYAGIEKKRSILRGAEKETVARHEVGHALVGTAVSRLLPGLQSEVEKLSIVPRSGGALGFAYMPPGEDRALMFDAELLGRLAIFMGGRAAEELTCERVSTGAVDDIQRATEMAYKAVAEYGLSSAVGPLSYLKLQEAGAEGGLLLGGSQGKTGERVEAEVKRLLDEALGVARAVLQHNRAVLAELSGVLADEERLEGDSLREGLAGVSAPPALVQYLEAPGDRRRAEKAGWGR